MEPTRSPEEEARDILATAAKNQPEDGPALAGLPSVHVNTLEKWLANMTPQLQQYTAEVLPNVSKVAGVWRSLSWCLESDMLWCGITGFTKFGDKCVNDLDLL